MRESDLPSPSIGGKGHHLRRVAVQAISQIETSATHYPNGRHPQAVALAAFFTACANALTNLAAAAPTMTFTPTAKSFSIAAGANQAGPVLNKGGSDGAVTYTSSDLTKATVNATTGAVTPVAAGTATITATIAANGSFLGATKTYTATITA